MGWHVVGMGWHAKYDSQFQIVFEAIRQLIEVEEKPKRKIGFIAKESWQNIKLQNDIKHLHQNKRSDTRTLFWITAG
jgi:hypothetical protein